MRPHVDMIHVDDLIWRPAELPGGVGLAVQQNLSTDEEDGSCSARVVFHTDFARQSGSHTAATEWFVLKGSLTVGDTHLGPNGYFFAPPGVIVPPVSVSNGTEALIFREYGDSTFLPAALPEDWRGQESGGERAILVADTKGLPEEAATADPVLDLEPGLFLRFLRRTPTGGSTRLLRVAPGWSDARLFHHPCYEEHYCLEGELEDNFGVFTPGAYCFRPAWIKHGNFRSHPETGLVWLLRSDASGKNMCTVGSAVEVVPGEALNYDPEREAPVVAGYPVRSRRYGTWDGTGR